MKKQSLFKIFTYTLVILLWHTWSTPILAKTVPVAEIIKTTQTNNLPHIVLDEIAVDKLLENSATQNWRIAKSPLFLERANLFGKTTVRNSFTTQIDPKKAYELINTTSPAGIFEPVDAKLVLVGNRVTEFSPGQDGLLPDKRLSTLVLLESTPSINSKIVLTGFTIPPRQTLAETNNLGIDTFLAGGVSDFSNSSKNRIANITAGMEQMRGVLIKPGEVFSFGEYLGDITPEKGFKPEIVIKADGLKPELGGGICQVSSTLFRAVMQSGMAITQRKNHAFSVSHYFPVGTDATIYTPVTDFKFINDTPARILIWPYYSSKDHLTFDLYGTKDARQVVVDEPVQWDRKADGSMKASWTRHVTINGQTRDDIIKSTYLPPALFKKEEKFVVAEPPPIIPTETTPSPTPSPSI